MSAVKADVHDVGEIFHQHIRDAVSDFGGLHVLALFFHILALVEHGDDRCVGGRTADALVLHRLDEGRVRVTNGRLGELLLGFEAEAVEKVSFLNGREKSFSALFVALGGLAVLPDCRITRKLERLAARLQSIVAVCDLHLHGVVQRFRHLRCNKTLVDEFVDVVVLVVEQFFHRLGRTGKIDGTDRLVRVLRALLGGVVIGLFGKVFLAVIILDILPCRRLCVR